MDIDKIKYREIIFTVVVVLLLIILSGCGPEIKSYKFDIKIDPNGKVYYKYIFNGIGCKISQDTDLEFESLTKDYIEGSNFEDSIKESCSNFELKMKKFWVDDGSLNAVFLFELPDLKSFLNSLNEVGIVKKDEHGNFYCSVDLKEAFTLETNGKVKNEGKELKTISWPSKSSNMYYSITVNPDYKITSFADLFFKKYGPSKMETY